MGADDIKVPVECKDLSHVKISEKSDVGGMCVTVAWDDIPCLYGKDEPLLQSDTIAYLKEVISTKTRLPTQLMTYIFSRLLFGDTVLSDSLTLSELNNKAVIHLYIKSVASNSILTEQMTVPYGTQFRICGDIYTLKTDSPIHILKYYIHFYKGIPYHRIRYIHSTLGGFV